MQTACNTLRTSIPIALPSINDPSLDAVQTCPAPEPSHEELMAMLESETQSVPVPIDPSKLTDPGAIALSAHGPDWYAKAQKMEDCARFGFIATCGKGHVLGVRVLYCNCRFGECCRDRKAEETVKRWGEIIEHVTERHRDSKYVLLSLRIPAARSKATASGLISQVGKDIACLMSDLGDASRKAKETNIKAPCFHGEQDPYWVNCLGYLGDDLIIRALIIDTDSYGAATIPSDTWKRLWPNAQVTVNVGKHLGFRSAFNSLVKPLPLNDPKDCAAQEILFHHMQMLRSHKISLTCQDLIKSTTCCEIEESLAAEELSVETPTDNSSDPSNTQPSKGKPASPCPICGDTHTIVSSRMRMGSQELTSALEKLRESSMNIRPPG